MKSLTTRILTPSFVNLDEGVKIAQVYSDQSAKVKVNQQHLKHLSFIPARLPLIVTSNLKTKSNIFCVIQYTILGRYPKAVRGR